MCFYVLGLTVSVLSRGISFPNKAVNSAKQAAIEAFPSPLGASHFQMLLSLTPRIPCGLAERFAWENQIGASFMSSASPKSPQTQHLSHARENRSPLPLSLIPHSHYNTRFIITQSFFHPHSCTRLLIPKNSPITTMISLSL